ncbi:sugar phosphate isomerase/epimerase [Rhodococcus sp. NCIMB 12038]|uniref:sugar phosphate isomerase/epimerase family protein n=1 Tax=Rhodococcus sp. NCIMB 12038 TaxID=933800 RepID=UPI000B3CCC89|nr:sugar phosphate isomerase/epimerase family protein [Rhodococcus sp. NCIMB 12038]OUS96507.1 hypothetical protein CA951_07180 [Rhodococcus sp. NCIMB 12038]
MTGPNIDLIATCWTSAGDVTPMMPSEKSPLDILDRVREVAATGWSGIGIAHDDLAHVDDTIGFAALREAISTAGLRFTEIEFLVDWWETDEKRIASDRTRDLLMRAAAELDPIHIKVGTAVAAPLESTDSLVGPLRDLADHAAGHGVRVAIEPMPYTMLSSVPLAADVVRAVDRTNCGVMVDAWHVFRAGTTLDDLRKSLTPDIIFGVELDDAAADVVGTLLDDSINERLLCGEGTFDLVGLVQTLTDIGFRGPWGTEIISHTHRALSLHEALDKARRALDTVVRAAMTKEFT